MEILELKASERSIKGKQNARKIRNEGNLPAVVYGMGSEPMPLTINAREFYNMTHAHAGANLIIKLNLDGAKTAPTVILKEVQKNPVRDNVLHVDFHRIKLDQLIHAAVSINVVGDSVGIREGGVLNVMLRELTVEALPTDIPEVIDIDITTVGINESVKVGDIPVSDKFSILTSEDETIVSIAPPTVVEEVAPEEITEVAEGEAEAAPAEKETAAE